jgi:GNAT superfamily N-acetyltransferase
MIKIAVMKHTDIEFARHLTDIEKWGHLEDDFQRLLYLDPAGCFVAWQDTERVGIVTTVSYKAYAFLGNLIVAKEERAKGVGFMLMKHAVSYLDQKGVRTIELDGVFAAVSIYRRLRFEDKYLSLRFVREVTEDRDAGIDERHLCPKSSQSVLMFDREKTGIDRSMLLKSLVKEYEDTTYCLGKEKISAYAVVRKRANGVLHIGPFVAENRMACDELLSSIIGKHRGSILTIGALEINRAAIEIVLRYGFEYRPPSLRMYRGQRLDYGCHVYGIVSADVG